MPEETKSKPKDFRVGPARATFKSDEEFADYQAYAARRCEEIRPDMNALAAARARTEFLFCTGQLFF